jgi:hypothetical protein
MGRPLSAREVALIEFIAADSIPSSMLAKLRDRSVMEMDDGGMGSLRFVGAADRRMGSTVGYAEFKDADGVSVSAALLLDQTGQLFELGIWKVDFRPLIRIPDATQFRAVPPGSLTIRYGSD